MQKKPDIHTHFSFLRLLAKFQSVERVAYAPDLIRNENDVEHSYMLAMLAWQIIDAYKLPLDRDKVLRYALVHDLVEAHAGDTYFDHARDAAYSASKHEREQKAAKQIAEDHEEFSDLHAHIAEYERRADPESKFVYALDKLIPFCLNYLQDGKRLLEEKVSYDWLLKNKREKCAGDPVVADLLEQLIELTTARRDELFVA